MPQNWNIYLYLTLYYNIICSLITKNAQFIRMDVYQSQYIISPTGILWPVTSYIEWRTHLYNRFFLCQGVPGQTPQRLSLRRIGWNRRSWTPTAKARPWPRRPHGITSRNFRVRHKPTDNNFNFSLVILLLSTYL